MFVYVYFFSFFVLGPSNILLVSPSDQSFVLSPSPTTKLNFEISDSGISCGGSLPTMNVYVSNLTSNPTILHQSIPFAAR